jgi:beta-1,4-N-acetylglucosaminyltransferase
MILVTVGVNNHGFERLIRASDELARIMEEPFVIQYGKSSYVPVYALHKFRFIKDQEMERFFTQARVIISHAAAGTILQALKQGKPLIIVPRLKQYGEALDDHQVELSTALNAQGRVIEVRDASADTLMFAVQKAVTIKPMAFSNSNLIEYLKRILATWSMEIDPKRQK